MIHDRPQDDCDPTRVRSALVALGIRAELVTAPEGKGLMVWVPAQDFARAAFLLRLLPRSTRPQDQRSAACRSCTADIEGRFDTCWNCTRE
jgi:hypothetical protein